MHMSFYDDPQNTKRTEQEKHIYMPTRKCVWADFFFSVILVNMSFNSARLKTQAGKSCSDFRQFRFLLSFSYNIPL